MAFASKPANGPKIREKIAEIGEGRECRLKLVDGTQAKGVIVNIHADNIVLKAKGVDEPLRIDYTQIAGVHKAGMSDAKVAITIVSVTGAVVIGMLIWFMYEWTHS
jgi:hypothetical protein